jgi:hypothetical protein
MKMKREGLVPCVVAGVAIAGMAGAAQPPEARHGGRATPFDAASMIIEYNSTDEDVGIQFFLDSEGWREIEIFDPSGHEIFDAESGGRLAQQGGGTELFLESVEPALEDLPLDRFFRRFPAGTYRFRGIDKAGHRLTGETTFSHRLPAGPDVVLPMPARGAECADNVPARSAVVAWNPVTEDVGGRSIDIARYEVIVENEDDGFDFDVKFPAGTGTMLSIPPELLRPGTSYTGEVLAVEPGGNQTITGFCFTTAG